MSDRRKLDVAQIMATVGLPETATRADYDARLVELAQWAAATRVAAAAPARRATRIMLREQYELMLLAAEDGRAEVARVEGVLRDRLIEKAVSAGRFPRTAAPLYRRLLDIDPQGTVADIEAMPPGLIPRELRDAV